MIFKNMSKILKEFWTSRAGMASISGSRRALAWYCKSDTGPAGQGIQMKGYTIQYDKKCSDKREYTDTMQGKQI